MKQWMSQVALLLACPALPGLCLAGAIPRKGRVCRHGPGAAKGRGHDRPVRVRQREGRRRPACVAAQGDPNAVVWIENPPPGADAGRPAAEKVEIDQNGCVFIPRIVVVPAGGTVDFLNSDRLLHNIHATPKLNVSFNRTQPKGRTIPVTFAEARDRAHQLRPAFVDDGLGGRRGAPLLRDHRRGRAVRLRQPAAGQYKLQVWHERLGTVPASVTVAARRAAPRSPSR